MLTIAAAVAFMRGRPGRIYLVIYLALVAGNYALDALRYVLAPPPQVESRLFELAFDCTIADPAALLLFAWSAAGDRPSRLRSTLGATPSVVLLILRVFSINTAPIPFIDLFVANLAGCYLLALGAIARSYVQSATTVERDARAVLLLAMGLVVLPRLPLVMTELGFVTGPGGRAELISIPLLEGTLAALLAGFALILWRAAPQLARPHVRHTLTSLTLLLVVVVALWMLRFIPGLIGPAFALLFASRWFLVLVVVSQGLQRHELLGYPTSLGGAASILVRATFAIALFFQTAAFFAQLPGATPTLVYGGALAALGVVSLAVVTSRQALRPRGEGEWRRESAYRAHLELGTPPQELARIREQLGLSRAKAREIEMIAAVERGLPRPPRRPAVGELFAGRYEVQRVAGVGAFGRIFEARDIVRGDTVILKELREDWQENDEAVHRILAEAKTALTVRHARLVALRTIEHSEGGSVLVFDRAPGDTLRVRLSKGPLTPAGARTLAQDLLEGLGALHEHGILHRDIKPENIVVDADGHATLLDFGAVGTIGATGTRLAGGGAHPGTPVYMSPEQAAGLDLDPSSDLYAAATVIREALGRPVPAAWEPTLDHALAAKPADRFATAREFLAALPGP
ncbi:MAG: serine/threonine-protein kinase [Thermoplasmatota archaeon]